MAEWIVFGESSKQDRLVYVVDSYSAEGAIDAVARRVWCKYHDCGCHMAAFERQNFITADKHQVDKYDLVDPSWCWRVTAMRVEQGKNLWNAI